METIPFINLHSHRKPLLSNEKVIRNAYTSLTKYQLDKITYPVSVGIHPWFVEDVFGKERLEYVSKIANHQQVFAIGEVGLDRAAKAFSLQKKVFEAQVEIAQQCNKPLIIHAVKTYSEFIPYLKKAKIPFIFHFFMGNETEANALLKHENVYLSFGKNFFISHQKSLTVFEKIPLSRVFLETDIMPISIEKVYEKAAELRKMEVAALKSQIFTNFTTIFQ